VIQFTFSPPITGGPNYYNIGAATARGVEVDADARLGGVELGASWTWLDTEVTDAGLEGAPGDLFVDGQPLIRRPEHSLALRAAASVGTRARVHTRVSHQGERDDRDFATFPATPVDMPSYTTWSVGGEWALRDAAGPGPAVTLYARAENLLDERYQETIGFAAPGRQLYFGASVDFGGGD
jgi:vitamin B12 transporter